ncbi:MAG TPA: ABC transporter permease [Gammaproteobacteria bacterium]|nr:ABC transporter permease [Gammaproteobacteria bacterium]
MLRHYVALALRNSRRTPVAAAVNVLTLALGLACFVIVYAFVAFWQNAEGHFAKADRIAVLTMSMRLPDGGFAFDDEPRVADVVAQYLKADFPQIERVARATRIAAKTSAVSGDRSQRLSAVAADPEFLDLFELPFAAGDARTALATPRSAVMTKAAAAQLFGNAAALGKSVRLENAVDVTITGVIDAVPEPSHLGGSSSAPMHFDLLTSRDVLDTIEASKAAPGAQPPPEDWLRSRGITYALLPADGSFTLGTLRARLPEFVERHVPKATLDFASLRYGAVPLRSLLPRSVDGEFFLTDLGLSATGVLLLLAGVVLGVACVNYANLATARAAARLREVGLRKALGAQPRQLMLQHLAEAALATGTAAVLAFAIFRAALPVLAEVSGTDVGVSLLSLRFWAGLGAAIVAVTLLAGAYPAFALSRFDPAIAIRASRATLGPRRLATLLIGSQFAVASFLLIAATVVTLQNAKLRRTGLNAAADPLVLIDITSGAPAVDRDTLRAELLRSPEIKSVTAISNSPWNSLSATLVRKTPDTNAPSQTVITQNVGFDFFSTFDLTLLAGRVFDRGADRDVRPADDAEDQPVVVDRAFTKAFGFESPAAAVGAVVYQPNDKAPTPLRIVGVIEDKAWIFFDVGNTRASLYQLRAVLPYTVVKVDRANVAHGLERIDAAWKAVVPNVAIERQFLDEIFGEVYESFLRLSQAFTALSAVAFAISVAGLFGTATLVTGRRRREIGVRKTHGASVARIVSMLLASFSKPVVIANVLVWPLAFVAARAYLKTFRDPIELGPLPFVASLAIVCAIAWLAVGTQTLRSARTRPADVLRSE